VHIRGQCRAIASDSSVFFAQGVMIDEVITPTFHSGRLPAPLGIRAQQSTMDQKDKKSLSRSLGEFFGHIWKGVQEPVGGAAPQIEFQREETTEQVRETEQGKVIVRRTVVEELEIPTPQPKK